MDNVGRADAEPRTRPFECPFIQDDCKLSGRREIQRQWGHFSYNSRATGARSNPSQSGILADGREYQRHYYYDDNDYYRGVNK
jgi:hypothetical protein